MQRREAKHHGEAALNAGGGKVAQVAMDIDPPPKRQRTGDLCILIGYAPAEHKHVAGHISQKRGTTSQFMTTPGRRPPAAHRSPHTHRSHHIFQLCPPHPHSSWARVSAGLAMLESMFARFPSASACEYSRLAAIRAVSDVFTSIGLYAEKLLAS
ncbi:hypothetical protein H4582DRAFT_2083622 [Lactarius indigo]|nr:hypothetical protein H4582DRAFT_2083622 [Lactarius indigo]